MRRFLARSIMVGFIVALIAFIGIEWDRAFWYLRAQQYDIPADPLAYNFTIMTVVALMFPFAARKLVRSGRRSDLVLCAVLASLFVMMLALTTLLLFLYCGEPHIDCVPDWLE